MVVVLDKIGNVTVFRKDNIRLARPGSLDSVAENCSVLYEQNANGLKRIATLINKNVVAIIEDDDLSDIDIFNICDRYKLDMKGELK